MRKLCLSLTLLPGVALAEAFDRPIPQAQSATAELWFAAATVALILALWVVHRMVKRK